MTLPLKQQQTIRAPERLQPQTLLTEAEVAKILQLTPRALQAWRVRGGGPAFIRISGRAIRYRVSDVEDWILARRRLSTSDPGPEHR